MDCERLSRRRSLSARTRDEIAKAEKDPEHKLQLAQTKVRLPEVKKQRGPRYTPLSRRQDRPNAILWLVRNHPELKDAQIMRLVGTTKSTLQAVRDRTHWNSSNLAPLDPVTLGICSQLDLDMEVGKANKDKSPPVDQGATLVSAEITTGPVYEEDRPQPILSDDVFGAPKPARKPADEDDFDLDSVFGKLKGLKTKE